MASTNELGTATEAPKTQAQQIPPGHLARELNMRERLLILIAMNALASAHDGKPNYAVMSKLVKLRELLGAEVVDDYFDALNDTYEDKENVWAREHNIFRTHRGLKGGALSIQDWKRMWPDLDPTAEYQKPSRSKPKATPEEIRGPSHTFYLKPAI